MKKMLIVLLALAVVGGVFAVDLPGDFKITGEVKTGVGIFGQADGDDDTDDIYAHAWNDDAELPLRTRLDFIWEGEYGGTKARLEGVPMSTGGETTGFYPNLTIAYGWANLLNKKVAIYGGHGVDGNFGSLGTFGVIDESIDGGDSIRVEVRPIEGLSIYYGLPAPINERGSLKTVFGSSRFGAKYATEKFSVVASFRLHPELHKDDTVFDVDNPAYTEDGLNGPKVIDRYPLPADQKDGAFEALFGIEVPALGPVGLNITGSFLSGDYGYFRVAPKVQFVQDKLTVYGLVDLNFALTDKGVETGHFYKGQVEAAGDADIGFELGAGYKVTELIKPGLALGSDNLGYMAGNGLWIKPYVEFAFGPNTSITLFDKIGKIGAESWKNAAGDDVSPVTNQFQIEMVWKF
ncbi:hypothetical protein AGMMS49944_22960 [Spirochaetia bacterium]|nr:hypothetical protein AGMMS49944_22960 [Spirochaetia bacterium]